jgi:hypothetical protein
LTGREGCGRGKEQLGQTWPKGRRECRSAWGKERERGRPVGEMASDPRGKENEEKEEEKKKREKTKKKRFFFAQKRKIKGVENRIKPKKFGKISRRAVKLKHTQTKIKYAVA